MLTNFVRQYDFKQIRHFSTFSQTDKEPLLGYETSKGKIFVIDTANAQGIQHYMSIAYDCILNHVSILNNKMAKHEQFIATKICLIVLIQYIHTVQGLMTLSKV